MTEKVIDILRPADQQYPFNLTTTLSGQNYRLRFMPGMRDGGSWFMSIDDVVGTVLKRSMRLVVGAPGDDIDLIGNDRALQPTLPPGKLVIRGPRDPGLLDLSNPAFTLVYIT